MSGTSTLTRTPPAPSPPFASWLAPPPRITSLRAALVVATFAMAFQCVETARQLVLSFNGTVDTLGSASGYWDGAATALAWVLATVALLLALRAAAGLDASRSARAGFAVAAAGTLLLALSSGCSIWATAVYSHATIGSGGPLSSPQASSLTREVVALSKAGLGLQVAGFVVLAVAAFVARPHEGRLSRAWRRVLSALGAAGLLAAVAPGVLLLLVVQGRSTTSGQLVVLMTTVPTALSWLAVAVALLLAASALGASDRTARLRIAAPFGVLGAGCLAIAATSIVVLDALLLEGTGAGWGTSVTRINSATAWAGWLVLTLALGIAATRLFAREVLPSPLARGRRP